MKTYQVYHNGLYLDEMRAMIPIADRAFLVGEGLFETLRSYQAHVVFLDEHIRRIFTGAHQLGMKIPTSQARLKFLIYELLHLNRLSNSVVRIYLTPEGPVIGDLDSSPVRINLLISTRPIHPTPEIYYQEGAFCVFSQGLFSEKGSITQLKSTNYLVRALARRQAHQRNALEGILLNTEGRVAEGSGSNVFMVKKGCLYTPPLSEGVLEGVTRLQVIKLAEKEGIPFEEKILIPDDLYQADEVFLTSTLKEILPVSRLEEKNIGSKTPGPVTLKLMSAYRDTIQWLIENHLSETSGFM